MTYSLAPSLILLGLAMIALAQMGMAVSNARGSVLKGVMCLMVPMNPLVQAKKSPLDKPLLAAWYLGIASLVLGGIIAS